MVSLGPPWWLSGQESCLPMQETQVQSPVWEDLEKERAAHSSILAWKIPWTGAWWATVLGVTESDTTE